MTVHKHTPGPWFFDQHGHVYGTLDGQHIEGVPGGKTVLHPHVCTPQGISNAYLITAAPELLVALEELCSCPQWVDEATVPKAGIEAAPQQVVVNMSVALLKLRKARAAITKATGEKT